MPEAVRSFPAESKSVGLSRRFLQQVLQAWGMEGYDFGAPLVLTELATNAVLHVGAPFEVRVAAYADGLVVEVRDGSTRLPRQRQYEVDATTGRGMKLVAALCDDWGASVTPAGKVVWAVVRTDDEATLISSFNLDDEPQPLQAAVAAGHAPHRSLTNMTCYHWAAA